MVLNFGINDVKHMSRIDGKRTVEYMTWISMLRRSKCEKFKHKHPTYSDVNCCDDWLVFSKFLKDLTCMDNFEKLKNDKWVLDKDILSEGNKLYSKDTCCIIPVKLNAFLTQRDAKRSQDGIGVFKTKNGKYRSSISFFGKTKNLGTYENSLEASTAYKKARIDYLKILINEYSDFLKEDVVEALFKKVSVV